MPIGSLTESLLWSSEADCKNWRFYCDKRVCESGLPLAVAVTSYWCDRRVCKNLSLTIYGFEKRRYKIQCHHRHSRGERWVSRHVTAELALFLCLVTWGGRQRRLSKKKITTEQQQLLRQLIDRVYEKKVTSPFTNCSYLLSLNQPDTWLWACSIGRKQRCWRCYLKTLSLHWSTCRPLSEDRQQ